MTVPDSETNGEAASASSHEAERLARLASYEDSSTEAGNDLNNIVQLASELFDVPIALVSMVGAERQTFAARVGLEQEGTSREVSFCAHTIQQNGVFIVPDATRDARFAENPLVTGDPGIRFYAGAPLISPLDGEKLGSLCIIDRAPRPAFSPRQQAVLTSLASLVMDRMELRRVEAERRSSNARFDRMVEATTSAVICSDSTGRITSWNAAAEQLLGWSASEIMGKSLNLIVPQNPGTEQAMRLARLAVEQGAGLPSQATELLARRRDGSEFPAEIALSCWRENQRELAFGTVVRDISRRKEAEQQLIHAAQHDSVTGVANRIRLEMELRLVASGGGPVAVVLLDLDGLKRVNEVLGHDAGDIVLRDAAQRISSQLGPGDFVARLGGDEFVVLARDPNAAPQLAATLRTGLTTKPFSVQDRVFHIGVSTGTAVSGASDVESVLANADLALSRAKAERGGSNQIFQPKMRAEYQATRSLEEEVLAAVVNGEFELYYQPQVRMADRRMTGVESLLRWQHPTRGLLGPSFFLSALEGTAGAATVGNWAIDEACRQASKWRSQGCSLRVGVNLFAEQLREGNLDRTVQQALERYALSPDVLELEITERIVLNKSDFHLDPLRRIHASGVGIAFDDFGTGFASLATLKRFPLSRLKIDRSFVIDLDTDPYDGAIVDAVLALGRSLNLEVIAEGIETSVQEAGLIARGCIDGQGYLYGRALPAKDIVCPGITS